MPKHIGKYEILRSLGQGAMGEVYLAHHSAIGREVAIKTILPSAAKGEDAEGRFRREAAAAGQLNHPNLVTIYDFDKDQEVFYLVMEYVKGDDLEDLIKQRALSPSQFLEVLAQVCDGLSHAHRNGIIHRDIKPANVRVVRDGKNLLAKVMDFGIARFEDSNLTATGVVMGTVSYMAPEYIREGHATAQSDLFAVGVMLYECLTGRKPFAGDNTTTILFKIVSDTPPPLDLEDTQGISPSTRLILDKALAKDPKERFQTAEDLAKALRACKDPTWSGVLDEATSLLLRQRLLEAVPAQEAPAPPTLVERRPGPEATAAVPSIPPPLPRPRRTALYAACAGAVLLAGGGAVLAVRSRTKAPDPAPAMAAQAAEAPVPAPAPAAAPATPAPAPPAPAKAAPAPRNALPTSGPANPPTSGGEPPRPAAPAPRNALPTSGPANPPASAGEPPRPAAPADPLKNIDQQIASDPGGAAAALRPLAQAQPAKVDVQGNFLAALYRSRNVQEFDRALTRATANGVTTKAMLRVPAFRAAMADESRLSKAKAGVLPENVMAKVLEGL
jgi:serine/threonine-protein kinase